MLNKAIKKAKENKKGFTLAELLIVVAIIAVLVAISIPIFTSQLEKSREATDAANLRAAYAEVSAVLLTETEDTVNDIKFVAAAGSTSAYAYTNTGVVLKQQKTNWQSAVEIAGVSQEAGKEDKIPSSGTVYIKVDGDGHVSFSGSTFAPGSDG